MYYALAAIPFAGQALATAAPGGYEALFGHVRRFLSLHRRGVPAALRPLSGEGAEDEEEDFLEDLWGRVCVQTEKVPHLTA